ncbi:hypothetical protein EVAR_77781_1 [Eumeta japonica]|uniref:Uncharacterized protein n=1 Tax=Eumeta variegata TaxID=151549 RepID=A0A4C1TDY3_EUMVA|nr:hypothetical protein EVAR_77781_1 [Eumeta japonica]
MYVSESWVWNKKNESRITEVEMRSLRSTCGVYRQNRSTNSDVRERCGLKEDVVTRVERGGGLNCTDSTQKTERGISAVHAGRRTGRRPCNPQSFKLTPQRKQGYLGKIKNTQLFLTNTNMNEKIAEKSASILQDQISLLPHQCNPDVQQELVTAIVCPLRKLPIPLHNFSASPYERGFKRSASCQTLSYVFGTLRFIVNAFQSKRVPNRLAFYFALWSRQPGYLQRGANEGSYKLP